MKKLMLAILLLSTNVYAVTSSAPRVSITAPRISVAPTFKPTFTAPVSTGLKTNNTVSSKFGANYNSDNVGQKQAAANTLSAIRPTKPIYVPPADVTRYRTQYTNNALYTRVRSDRNAYNERISYYNNPTHIVYVEHSSPSFGLLSGVFLYSIMSNAATAAEYAHNHSNDADYLAWRREANRLAATNEQLRQQLAAADAQSTNYSNKPVDPNWLPEGVPPAAALSDEALKASQPDLNVCVGPENGTYYKVAQQYLLPDSADLVNIVPVITKGSLDIRQKLLNNTCDAAFLQGDIALNNDYDVVFHPFLEYAHLICYNEHTNLKDVKVINIAQNSGSLQTWRNLAAKSSTLNNINVNETLGNEDAIASTIQNKSCLFYVAAPHNSGLNKLFERPELWLVPIDDYSLIDTTYSAHTLSSKDYPKEIRSGWFSNTEIKTFAIPVQFVIARKWRDANQDVAGKLNLELINMEQQIHSQGAGQ